MRTACRSLLALLLLGLAGYAQDIPPVQPPNASPIHVSPQRGGQIRSIRERYREQMQSIRQQIQQNRMDLGNLIENNAPEAQTRAKLRQIVELEGQVEDLNLQQYYEIRAILPPEKAQLLTDRVAQRVRHLPHPPASPAPR